MKKVLLVLLVLFVSNIYSQEYNCYEKESYLNRERVSVNKLSDEVYAAKAETRRLTSIADNIFDRMQSYYTPGTYSYNQMAGEYRTAFRKAKNASEYANSLVDIFNDRNDIFRNDIIEFNSKCVGKSRDE